MTGRSRPRPRISLPPHPAGARIGLFGGTFNPPHQAHRAVTLFALRRLGLDQVWWLVSPGNPLKSHRDLPPLAHRVAAARQLARHPRVTVTDIEAQIGTRYTVDTLRWLRVHCPGVRFVWIAGADVLGEFHRWRRWGEIADLVPLAFVDRGAPGLRALAGPAAQALLPWRIPEARAASLPDLQPPAWVFLHGIRSTLSSSALRRRGASD